MKDLIFLTAWSLVIRHGSFSECLAVLVHKNCDPGEVNFLFLYLRLNQTVPVDNRSGGWENKLPQAYWLIYKCVTVDGY